MGFDWPEIEGIRDKFLEEFEELQEALRQEHEEQIKEEIGDILFVALNIARYLQIDPETALKRANSKFSRRFRAMESHFTQQGRALRDVDLDEMEAVWQEEKIQDNEL